jgi:hypothetical protein
MIRGNAKNATREQNKGCPEDVAMQADLRNYPTIDPYQLHAEPWLNGALQLLSLLAPAVAATAASTQEAIPNCRTITDGALKIIPALAEAVLEAHQIAQQQQIAELLNYCGSRCIENDCGSTGMFYRIKDRILFTTPLDCTDGILERGLG